MVCDEQDITIMDWLCSICDDYQYITENYYEPIDYIIYVPITKISLIYMVSNNQWDKIIQKYKIKINPNLKLECCSVCYENGNLLTNCGHSYCLKCLMTWYVDNISCPYCKQTLELEKCQSANIYQNNEPLESE